MSSETRAFLGLGMISVLDIEGAFRLAYLRFGDKLGVGVLAIPWVSWLSHCWVSWLSHWLSLQPARILQNGSPIVVVPTIEVGVFGTGADFQSYACECQFVTPIGTRFMLEGGTRAQSNLLGIAEAGASGDATVRLDIGVCSNGAIPVCPTGVSAPVRQIPTLGHWGRLAVILLLAAAGLVAVRRRVGG